MQNPSNITQESDSIINLLAAQCVDLERLLLLAREETIAAELGNFGTILNITSERAAIGKRLETFHQQIAELRGFLGKSAETYHKYNETSSRVAELANQTLAQDQQTKLFLTAICENTTQELKKLETGNRGTNIYLREQKKGLAYNGNF